MDHRFANPERRFEAVQLFLPEPAPPIMQRLAESLKPEVQW